MQLLWMYGRFSWAVLEVVHITFAHILLLAPNTGPYLIAREAGKSRLPVRPGGRGNKWLWQSARLDCHAELEEEVIPLKVSSIWTVTLFLPHLGYLWCLVENLRPSRSLGIHCHSFHATPPTSLAFSHIPPFYLIKVLITTWLHPFLLIYLLPGILPTQM